MKEREREKKERDTVPCFSISTLTQKKEKKMKWNKLENNQLQRRLATSAHWATETPGHHLFSSLPREVCHTLHWWLGFFLFWLKQQKVRKKKEKKKRLQRALTCSSFLLFYWLRPSPAPRVQRTRSVCVIGLFFFFKYFISIFFLLWPQFQ